MYAENYQDLDNWKQRFSYSSLAIPGERFDTFQIYSLDMEQTTS